MGMQTTKSCLLVMYHYVLKARIRKLCLVACSVCVYVCNYTHIWY
jgi:hypothetical protein